MASQAYLGAIFLFAGNFNPRGFMLCQGQLLSIAQNTALFSILGTTYGGNGQTTFALPDLRGRVPVGQGAGPGLTPVQLGEVQGQQNVTILTSNMPAHNHLVNTSSQPAAAAAPGNSYLANSGNAQSGGVPVYISNVAPDSTLNPQSVSVVGNSVPINVLNPSVGLNYIIAVQGIFPSRN